jgi:hypothetical protein
MTRHIGVKIKTGAKENSIEGYTEINGKKFLKVNIKSIPEKGKANEEIINFLANEWEIPKSKIEISSGHTNKLKILSIKEYNI